MTQLAISCPYCGARFNVPSTAKTITCPYCGAVFALEKTGPKIFEENHFYFPVEERFDPYDRLMRFLSRQYAAPEDLRRSSSIMLRTLHYIPIYFFYCFVRGQVYGRSTKFGDKIIRVEELRYFGIPAVKGFFSNLLENYPFPLRGKKFFNPEIKKAGRFYEAEFDIRDALEIAKMKIDGMIRREAAQSLRSVFHLKYEIFNVDSRGLVHYPVWEIHYSYRGKKYISYIDGATGTVIKAEYPQTRRGRMSALGAATLIFAAGLVGSLIVLSQNNLLAAIAGTVVGAAAATPAFLRSATSKITVSELEEKVSKGGTLSASTPLSKAY